MIYLTLAIRNLWKNRRSSLATLAAIAVGFMAINLFSGYISNVYRGLADGAIHGEGLGHLIITKRGFFANGSLHPERYLFVQAELARLQAELQQEAAIELISPRLSVSGLVSNGRVSTIFIAEGEEPRTANRLWRPGLGLPQLADDQPNAGLVSKSLANMLDVKAGGSLVTLTSTLAGQTNALDLDVLAVWDTQMAATNDKLMKLPLAYVQKLLDTDGASRVVVLLKKDVDANRMRATLLPRLQAAGFDIEIKTWVELSTFYRQVKNLFDLIFIFLTSIVSVVALMSIVNTLSMSVMERVREIGTLRALGMKRSGIVRIFATEGGVLGLAGCVVGIGCTVLVTLAINLAHLQYTPPSSSSPVPLTVAIRPGMLWASLVALALVAMLAAFWPARRAAQSEIIDALGHV